MQKPNYTLKIASLILFPLLSFFIFLYLTTNVKSQNEIPIPLPTNVNATQQASQESETMPDWAKARLDMLRARNSLPENRKISDYRVTYFVSNSIDTAEWLDGTGINIVHNWADVETFHTATPMQALIVHASVKEEINAQKVRDFYRQGIVIVGINIAANELDTLLKNKCETSPEMNPDYIDDFFTSSYYFVAAENTADIDIANTNELEVCDENSSSYRQPQSVYRVKSGVSQHPMSNAEEVSVMFQIITGQIASIEIAKAQN